MDGSVHGEAAEAGGRETGETSRKGDSAVRGGIPCQEQDCPRNKGKQWMN